MIEKHRCKTPGAEYGFEFSNHDQTLIFSVKFPHKTFLITDDGTKRKISDEFHAAILPICERMVKEAWDNYAGKFQDYEDMNNNKRLPQTWEEL